MSGPARTPGHVILLNGPPSSGKSTIARALWTVVEPPHWWRSLDEFRKGYTEEAWDRTRGSWADTEGRDLFRRLIEGYLGAVRAMALAGHHVISEALVLPTTQALYARSLYGLTVYFVGIRCPIEVAEARERARAPAERHLGVPIDLRVPEFDLVHGNGAYEVEIDTSTTSVPDAVELIQARLADPKPPQWAVGKLTK